MSEKRMEKLISRFEQLAKDAGIDIYKIVLFGSYSKGKQNNGSDVDLAIISDSFKDRDIFERAIMLKNTVFILIREFDMPIDIIKLTIDEYENETKMIVSFVKEGKVLYTA